MSGLLLRVSDQVRAATNNTNIVVAGHTVATGSVLLSVAHYLTPVLTGIATLLAIVWYSLTIYEMQTTQKILKKIVVSNVVAAFMKKVFGGGGKFWKRYQVAVVKDEAAKNAAVDKQGVVAAPSESPPPPPSIP